MSKERLPFIKLFPGDWLTDDVSGCSLAAQGLWLNMMFVMHSSERYGYLAVNGSPMQPVTVAKRCRCDLAEYESLLAELLRAGVPSLAEDGTIFSRRMVRDHQQRQIGAAYGRKGGNPALKSRAGPAPLSGGLSPPVIPSLTVNMDMDKGGVGGTDDDGGVGAFLDATGLAMHYPSHKLGDVKVLLRIAGPVAARNAVDEAFAKGIGGPAAVTYASKVLASDVARKRINGRQRSAVAVREDR